MKIKMSLKEFFGIILILQVAVLTTLPSEAYGQAAPRNIRTAEYSELQKKLAQGWNTWYNNNVLSYTFLPGGFSINLAFKSEKGNSYLQTVTDQSESTKLDMRSNYGAYTSLEQNYNNVRYFIETASVGDELFIRVTPEKESWNHLIAEVSLPWDIQEGGIGVKKDGLYGEVGGKEFKVRSTNQRLTHNYTGSVTPKMVFSLNQKVYLYTGNRTRSANEIDQIINMEREKQERTVDSYGSLSEIYKAMQTVLSWNTIYDAGNKRVITPVSRDWSRDCGGFVMFDWDTYFASYMFGLFNKEMAYANAVEITKAITPGGFIPNDQGPFYKTSFDRSQPPVGSMVIYGLYRHYGDKWLLEEVYDELLTWNRWWASHRDIDGYLAWGSDPINEKEQEEIKNFYKEHIDAEINKNNVSYFDFQGNTCTMKAAAWESGLDNSPSFDHIGFNEDNHMMEMADVGLMGLYLMDCRYMVEIAEILDKKEDVKELKERIKKYSKSLNTLWNEEAGIYMNKDLKTGKFVEVLTPCNFYPLLAKACSQKQAETMIRKHYFNPAEFHGEYVIPSVARNCPAYKDNTYWRGPIWAPMNFLLYKGICNYNLPEARKDLVERSKKLFLKNWDDGKKICENYDPVTGIGGVGNMSDSFYHWGALLGFMSFLENGYMD